MNKPIKPQPGSNPDPADFVGRVKTSSIAQRKLLAGNNLALTDPRRMGKSFWMTYFCRTTDDFVPVMIDYEGVTTAEEFLIRTAEALGSIRVSRVPRGVCCRASSTTSRG